MLLKQFVQKLQALLANPNGLTVEDNIIYVFTGDSEFLAIDVAN